jgi:hypothetical protein
LSARCSRRRRRRRRMGVFAHETALGRVKWKRVGGAPEHGRRHAGQFFLEENMHDKRHLKSSELLCISNMFQAI